MLKFKKEEPEFKTATKTKYLINIRDCAGKYEISSFRITNHCNSVFDLFKLEAISVFLSKQEFRKQKEFDYKVSLINKISQLVPLLVF